MEAFCSQCLQCNKLFQVNMTLTQRDFYHFFVLLFFLLFCFFFFFCCCCCCFESAFFLYVLEVFLVVHLLIHNRFTFLCIFASHVRTICFSECQVNAISFSLFFFISCLLFVEPKSAERRKGHAHLCFFFFQVGALFHRSSGLFFFPRSSSFPLLSIFTPDFLFVPLSSGGAQRLLLHWLAVFFFFSYIEERTATMLLKC